MNICILIRVYDRIEDLLCNLRIIKDTWKLNSYEIIVVSNGTCNGYALPTKIYDLADRVITLPFNLGHMKGNSQLLLEGVKSIFLQNYDFLLILEADTWLYSDVIVDKYVKKMKNTSYVWASARWYDRFYSLATDFAIISARFLEKNIEIFDFETYPECYVYNYLSNNGYSSLCIKENMPTHLPSYIRKYPYAPCGRFYVFPKSKMVTHHVDKVKGGMNEKKYCFNALAGKEYFVDIQKSSLKCKYFRIKLFCALSKIFIRRSWFSKGKFFDFC